MQKYRVVLVDVIDSHTNSYLLFTGFSFRQDTGIIDVLNYLVLPILLRKALRP